MKTKKISLTKNQTEIFSSIWKEFLAEDEYSLAYDADEEYILPEEGIYQSARKECECLITGRKIKRGEKAIFIFAPPLNLEVNYSKRRIMAILADIEALEKLLSIGSIYDVPAFRKKWLLKR